jgi:hypothetical protein
MNSWLQRFLQGFRFQVNYPVLRYLAVCAGALAGAIIGAFLSNGDMTRVIVFGTVFYIIGRLVVWLIYR